MGLGWTNCDEELRTWVSSTCEALRQEVLGNHVGTYLHGSLASGSFYPPKSDVDIMLVVEDPLSSDDRQRFATAAALAHRRRPIVGGLECTVVRRATASRPVHPMPFEVHFSETCVDQIVHGRTDFGPNRTDPDLAAHVQAISEFGVALYGPPPSAVFTPFPRADFVDSIRGDLDWIVEGENIVQSPFYGILNLARVLWVLEEVSDRLVPSKDEAGAWLLRSAPVEHKDVIALALTVYRDASAVAPDQRRTGGRRWAREPLLRFRDWAQERASLHQRGAS